MTKFFKAINIISLIVGFSFTCNVVVSLQGIWFVLMFIALLLCWSIPQCVLLSYVYLTNGRSVELPMLKNKKIVIAVFDILCVVGYITAAFILHDIIQNTKVYLQLLLSFSIPFFTITSTITWLLAKTKKVCSGEINIATEKDIPS